MSEPEDIVTIVTSIGTEHQAVDISERLVHERLATCVNIVPCTRTIYRWKTGHICDDTEHLLFVKTPRSREDEVHEVLMKWNTYELPEVMSVPNPDVEKVTHQWVVDMVQPPKRHPWDDR